MEKWRREQRRTFTSMEKLADFLELTEEDRGRLLDRKDFPLHVPYRIAMKMEKGSLVGALALQFLPLDLEGEEDGGALDPVGDGAAMRCDSLLHKYEGRALLLTTSACAMHCRYCFRQNYPYTQGVEDALHAIGKDSSIREVILSGGDPLSLSDKALKDIFLSLEAMDHVEIVRIHTRFLVGIPERVTRGLLDIFEKTSMQVVFVLHVNHVEELDEDIFEALKGIQLLGIPVLTQTVLLRGVNNSKSVLYNLFMRLVKRGVIPYYLHQFDQVKGAMHFETSKDEGRNLIRALRDCMPGYAVPTYVQEVEGESSKTLVH
ncbi:KamA family radical SAM protein [bacterium]|nr:KamA family radical SAM protein [bacterium]